MPDQIQFEISNHRPLLGFQNLMRRRVREILLVSSAYDSFILAQDGQLNELLLSEYLDLNLQNAPYITQVSSGKEALEKLANDTSIDIVISTMNIADMQILEFARKAKNIDPDIPLLLLTYSQREIQDIVEDAQVTYIDRIFLWQGDFRILLAIVKLVEDQWNVDEDASTVGVKSIILIEDNIKFYSSYLPIIYAELMKQSQRLLSEGLNLAHKQLRMRARPKILLSTNFEEGWRYFEKYQEHILGIISDIEFPQKGKMNPLAGVEFAQMVKCTRPDIPILLQSNRPENAQLAERLKVSFLMKDSTLMLNNLRGFMMDNFGFGDFIFRLPEGDEVDRAVDFRELLIKLHSVPAESLGYHGEHNHFSTWLQARTEFELADKLKPRKVSEYKSLEDLRKFLINTLREFQDLRSRGTVSNFQRDIFSVNFSFALIGSGSLGGKARGLAFINAFLNNFQLRHKFEKVEISVPPTLVLGTDIFDRFMDLNGLWNFALETENDTEIDRKFLSAQFPQEFSTDLEHFLKVVKYPLAVRSSSLLEDSQYLPFAGIYDTYMLPNNYPNLDERLAELIAGIKRVFASTFHQRAKSYLKSTPYRLEEEKMAVIIQKLVGAHYNGRFYPNFAGISRSHNHYPAPPMKPTDGIAAVSLGLGKMVVEGGAAVRFCPKYPRHLIQFSTTRDFLNFSQKSFFALDMKRAESLLSVGRNLEPTQYDLQVAEADGTLGKVGSVYSPENDAVYDGLSRPGQRLITFAPILKYKAFPLPEILELLTDFGRWGINAPVEIEFAVNLSASTEAPSEFGFLQIRPITFRSEIMEYDLEPDLQAPNLLCRSENVLGNGKIDDICDIIMLERDNFNRADTLTAAREVGIFNAKLSAENRPYLLIGFGRWGSSDPWLGIPVNWEQISGVRAIIEANFKDFKVISSQGTHFFQNITSLMIGYFTIMDDNGKDFLDWNWLKLQPVESMGRCVKHVHLKQPLVIKMNGCKNQGVILKMQ